MQVTVTLTIECDVTDLEDTLGSVAYDDYDLSCDEVSDIYGENLEEKIDYLILCDSLGASYEQYCDHNSQYYTEAEFEENFCGEYSCIQDFIEEVHNLSDIPDFIKYNIDWNAVKSDLESDYTILDNGSNLLIYSA